jgi:hypothetical protein
MIINTRADLDALRGTASYPEALRAILGATTTWANDAQAGEPPQWRMVTVGDTLSRLGLTEDEMLDECASAGITPQAPEAPVSAPITPVDLVDYAADARWRREVGGIVVGGITIATDDRSKLLIAGARTHAEADPAWSTVWTAADGVRHPVSAAQVIAISAAVLGHVDAAFRLYDEVVAAIDAGTITTPAEIDAAFAVA